MSAPLPNAVNEENSKREKMDFVQNHLKREKKKIFFFRLGSLVWERRNCFLEGRLICISYVIQLSICILGGVRSGQCWNYWSPKVSVVDPPLENPSQPKKTVVNTFFHLAPQQYMVRKWHIFRWQARTLKLMQSRSFFFRRSVLERFSC